MLHLHHANRAKFSVRHHFASLANRGITGVIVSHSKKKAGAANGLSQVQCVFERRRERLVANYVDASLEKCLRRRIVQMVGGYDRDDIDAVFPRCLRRSHFCETAVSALWWNVQIKRGDTSATWIGRQRRRH